MIYITGAGTALTVNCEVEGHAPNPKHYSVLCATNSANLTLNDGADIHGGNAGNGGGVRMTGSPGTFTMNGGWIHGNRAGLGAGLSLDNHVGHHFINGGSIEGNNASGDSGHAGGIWVGSEVQLTMTGGTVTGNVSKQDTRIYDDIVVNSNSASKLWTGVYITSGEVTANIRIEGDSNTNGLTARLQISSGATLKGNVSIGVHSTGLAENKLQNEGTINGNVSLEDRTGLTNTGTINGTVTVEEIVIVDNSGTINKVVGAATTIPPIRSPPPPARTAASPPPARSWCRRARRRPSPSRRTPATTSRTSWWMA